MDSMWLVFAVCSAVFAGVTSILAKCGLQKVDSTVATAYRTIVAMLFAWAIVMISGTYVQIGSIDPGTWMFLILSGLATGASWLCYFKALQIGNVNKVVPVDKSSTVLGIMLAIVFLGESLTIPGAVGVVLILVGMTSILGKVGMADIDSNLGTAIRTAVVLAMSWIMVFVSRKQEKIRGIGRRDMMFIIFSGLATGLSWMFFFVALQTGPASIIIPIDKLSILVTIAFSYIVFKERLSKKSAAGLAGIVAGTLLLLVR